MDEGKPARAVQKNGERWEKFVVIDETLGGRSAGNPVGANRLEINERCIGRREARDRLRRLERQLHPGLGNRNAPGVAGLAIIVVGAMPVERRVKAQ
jgi:hypothetical protein